MGVSHSSGTDQVADALVREEGEASEVKETRGKDERQGRCKPIGHMQDVLGGVPRVCVGS